VPRKMINYFSMLVGVGYDIASGDATQH
jgi:hypothetical protein